MDVLCATIALILKLHRSACSCFFLVTRRVHAAFFSSLHLDTFPPMRGVVVTKHRCLPLMPLKAH